MRSLQLKANYKVIRNYYQEINNLAQLSLFSEGTVSPAFAGVLRYCAGQFNWTLAEQYTLKRNERNIRVDGALLDPFKLLYGIWEAKDTADDLAVEVKKKFEAGYPRDNILFQSPERAILWQHGQQILDEDISRPGDLVETLKQFFTYQPPAFEQWEQAVDEFKDRDKTQLRYNDFLTLAGIPPETFDYRLGNRSALDWIIDQYRVKTDKRSGITNDPNRLDDPQYIVRLIGQVITVSLETVAVVKGLPALE